MILISNSIYDMASLRVLNVLIVERSGAPKSFLEKQSNLPDDYKSKEKLYFILVQVSILTRQLHHFKRKKENQVT